eukprot:scaffold12360_cov109-Isochrysis_galbana.AAC.18
MAEYFSHVRLRTGFAPTRVLTKAPRALPIDATVTEKKAEPAELEYASCCFLPSSEWTSLPLCGRFECSHDSTVYEFALPRCTSLNLPACSCILLQVQLPASAVLPADSVPTTE